MAGRAESFIDVPPDSDFSLNNLPWGVFARHADSATRSIGVALGSHVIDIKALADAGLFAGPQLSSKTASSVFQKDSLNQFMSLGRPAWREARDTLTRLLSSSEGVLRDDAGLRERAVVPMADVVMHMPASVGDYTDFYASREHATNVGAMFRGIDNALNPNWVRLPVGYHGRASSIVASGVDVRRPWGQVLPPDSKDTPVMAPSSALDFELEMACFLGPGNALGDAINVDSASEHIFGMVLMNDWSARDIQKWECLPLGPFNSKNWATQVSPWVVTMDALEPFRVDAPRQDPPVLPYLQESVRATYDIQLAVDLIPAGTSQPCRVADSNLKHMYWTLEQMVAHHTLGGCNLRPGDLLGSGTISGDAPGQAGCLLEATKNGTQPIQLHCCGTDASTHGAQAAMASSMPGTSQQRSWLLDGDTVVLRGYCQGDGCRVGFGECRGTVLPAR